MKTNTPPAPARPVDRNTLQALHQRRPGLLNLEEALAEACREEGVSMKLVPESEPRWAMTHDVRNKVITWKAPSFGKVTAEVCGREVGPLQRNRLSSWAQIIMADPSKWIVVRIMVEPLPGVTVSHRYMDKITPIGADDVVPRLNIPVGWDGNTPRTTSTDDHNANIRLVNGDGHFIQLEIGVTTRHGYFWLSMQELWCAQLAHTTKDKASRMNAKTVEVDGRPALALPLYPECNYPGADFLNIKGMMTDVIETGVKAGLSRPLSKCSLPKWEAAEVTLPESLAKNGWGLVTVYFFNAMAGWGIAVCQDGETCFIHFKAMLDEQSRSVASTGKFPIIAAMSKIAVKWKVGDKGRSAIAIHVL